MQNKRMKRKLVQWSKHGLLSHIRSPLQVVACAMYSSVVQVYSSGDGTKTLRVTAIRSMIWPGWSPSFESASDFSSVLSFYHSHILFIIFIIFIIVHLCFSQCPLAGMLKPGAVTVVKGTRFANLYATGLHLGTCSNRLFRSLWTVTKSRTPGPTKMDCPACGTFQTLI